MSKVEEYRANAAECDRMARTARDEAERRTWKDMAQSWSRMAEQKSAKKTARSGASPDGGYAA